MVNPINQLPKHKKKRNYLEKDPSVLFYNDRSKTKNTIIGILKNGNISDLKPVNIDRFGYTLTNTCAFDSLVHLVCSSYVNSMQYSMYIDQEILHDFFRVSFKCIEEWNYYTKKRVVISIKIMCALRTWIEDLSVLETSIEFIIRNIFTNYRSLLTVEKCLNCFHTKKKKKP